MLIASKALVLGKIPYNDRIAIATLFLREEGFVSYRVPIEGGKKSSATRFRRFLYPLSEVEIIAEHLSSRSLQTIKEIAPSSIRLDLTLNPTKRALSFFLAEILEKLLRNGRCDPPIYDFISFSLETLDKATQGIENFHLAFLFQLLYPLGIAPEWRESFTQYIPGSYFSLREVRFLYSPPLSDFLNPQESLFLRSFAKISYKNMHFFQLNGKERRQILEYLFRFYRIHYGYINNLQTPNILRLLWE